MAKTKKGKFKFQFGIDFQEKIIQYILTDQQGYKILSLIDDTYFTLLSHAAIVYAVKKYFKKSKRVPEEAFLREYLRELKYRNVNQLSELSEDDTNKIEELLTTLYKLPVSDPETIKMKVINFAKYVRFKANVEEMNIEDYESYEAQIRKLNEITNIGRDLLEDHGTFLIEGFPERAHRRHLDYDSTPTPFWQLNRLLNAGGTEKGNLITIIAEEKRFKTGLLVNVGRGYLKMKKRGVYFDLENGEKGITIRNEQSFSGHTRQEILSEEYDNKIAKLFRKYKRLGAELNIKRFPALTTTTQDFQNHLDTLWKDHAFKPDFVIVDYGLLMASLSGKKEDFGRISDAFLDLKNFAHYNNLCSLWTVAHVTREATTRRSTKYIPKDIAKCIDIPRHIDILLGLQESDEETQSGVMRVEVIEQRDGLREGKCLFWVDIEKQSMKEFSKAEVSEYMAQLGISRDSGEETDKPKKKRSTDL